MCFTVTRNRGNRGGRHLLGMVVAAFGTKIVSTRVRQSQFVPRSNRRPTCPTFNVENFVFQNNILYSPNFSTFIASNVYFNNISTNAVIPSGNGNVNNATFSTLYLGGISTGLAQGPSQLHTQDSAWMLAATSPAIGAGALNGTTVDCGAFGGPAPYVLSGMSPGIPSIYALTAPVQVNSGTASINVTISAASH